MGLGFTIGVLGVLILSHAAYLTIQYRGLLKITEEEFSGPPMNVVAELILGFLFCLYAALTVPGKFKSIHPDSEENSMQHQGAGMPKYRQPHCSLAVELFWKILRKSS